MSHMFELPPIGEGKCGCCKKICCGCACCLICAPILMCLAVCGLCRGGAGTRGECARIRAERPVARVMREEPVVPSAPRIEYVIVPPGAEIAPPTYAEALAQ